MQTTTRRTKFINLSITALLKTTLLLFSVGIIVVVAAPPHVNAFKDLFHADINDESLAFLKSDILSEINTADISAEDIKKFKTSIFHLYSCDFQGTTENINRLYDQLLINHKPETFGLLLHPVQDFYAHSNWVELERKDLIDTNDDKWTVLKPFQEYKGIIIVQQGEDEDDDNNNKDDINMDYTLSRTGKVVYVSSQSYEKHPGLISTVYGSSNYCPEDIALDHDTLNKDIPDRVGYPQARVLAEAQTIHEWCRLLNLVELSHGQAGVQLLFDSWVEDKDKANSVCHRSPSPYVPPSSPFSLPSGITSTATETPSETK